MSRYIDADVMIDILRKSHESHAENSREESLLARDVRLVQEQAKYHPVIIEGRPQGEWKGKPETRNLVIRGCTSCGERGAVGNFCMWCGSNNQVKEGGEK